MLEVLELTKKIEPKIGHWSGHVLCWAFIVLGIIISLSRIDIVKLEYDWMTLLMGVYFIFAGIFLFLESMLESGKFSMPAGVDMFSAIIAVIAFIIGGVTLMQEAIPVEWTGVYFLMGMVVAVFIGLEFYTAE